MNNEEQYYSMNVSSLLTLLSQKPYYQELLHEVNGGKALRKVLVVTDAAKPFLIATLHHDLKLPVLVITAHSDDSRRLYEEFRHWDAHAESILSFPEAGFLPENYIAPDTMLLSERIKTLSALVQSPDPASAVRHPYLIVSHASAASGYIISPQDFGKSNIPLSVGMTIDPVSLISVCQTIGYILEDIVEVPGLISRRGGIIDVFSRNFDAPVRLEFFGNQIESIRFFDPKTQRSVRTVSSVTIVPSSEESDTFHRSSIFDYLPDNAVIILDDMPGIEAAVAQVNSQWDEFIQAEPSDDKKRHPYYFTFDLFLQRIQQFSVTITLSPWVSDIAENISPSVWPFASLPNYGGRLDAVIADLRRMADEHRRIVIISQQPDRLNELLLEHDIIASYVSEIDRVPPENSFVLLRGSLTEGWLLKNTVAIFTDREIFGIVKQQRLSRKRPIRHHTFTNEFEESDYVVHVDHGIARFVGIIKRLSDDIEKEYLVLQYANDDRLFVPVDQIDRVSRYIGASDQPPALSHFGTQEWVKTKLRVRKSVVDMARALLNLYATREVTTGFAFSPDTLWQQELELSFPYTETTDQLSAINAVKQDMERLKPMERLVCGDVGYGKTEVALRAAFKAVMDNKQVAVLVPTTILAQQHFNTFSERLKAFPIRVKMLSRFCSAVEEQRVIEELSAGQVDICIGTHRLLQKDISFKSLGLLIVDEEQRFGVGHKEYLKNLTQGIDVLTLSATPIPRTLHMSLVGIRDMSTIETPPEDRLPITTFVGRYEESTIREAILRELERNGQIFYVHNRVSDIDLVAQKLKTLVPEARILFAHGQMSEDGLERVMTDFASHKADVLVTTTIIESGLDMPNVNTLIVDKADKFGLTQLYQLRGRIGRGSNMAYAYFFYNTMDQLNELARKRLATIAEATELGAGFAIAMRDLEIRGAGNLLGAEQSGHIAAVGYDLYCHLLSEAIRDIKDAQPSQKKIITGDVSVPSIALPLDAYIPESYISAVNARLSVYQRLVLMNTIQDISDMERELIDRFGQLPQTVQDLLYVVRVRYLASKVNIESINYNNDEIIVYCKTAVENKEMTLLKHYENSVDIGHKQVRITRDKQSWKSALLHVLESMGTVIGSIAKNP